MSSIVNCSSLTTRTSFDSYARLLLNETNGDLQLLSQCKLEVCVALWGDGNGDISGIGVMIGYALDHVLGLGISLAALYLATSQNARIRRTAWDCLNAFSDCALIFALAIQVAAIIVLVREDFGKSTSGMGDDTVRITQAVSMAALLALVYPILAFRLKSPRVDTTLEPDKDGASGREEVLESSIRFGQIVLCWLLAFYPFYSKMNAAFGPSRIGKTPKAGGHAVLSNQQYDEIQQICFGKTRPITASEDNWMTAFVILTYVPLSLFVLGRILYLGIEDKHPDSRLHMWLRACRKRMSERSLKALLLSLYGVTPLLAAGLLWSIIYTQRSQAALTASFGGTDSDNEWTFGQIVALTVFAPVGIQMYRTYSTESDERARLGGKEGKIDGHDFGP